LTYRKLAADFLSTRLILFQSVIFYARVIDKGVFNYVIEQGRVAGGLNAGIPYFHGIHGFSATVLYSGNVAAYR